MVFAVPKVRNEGMPRCESALAGLWSVARVRRKRVELFGGNVASELLYALALGATCLAYGAHLNLAELVFVNTAAAVLSGLIPVPGGIGAAEAASPPASSRWGRRVDAPSRSPSPSDCARSTCRPSGATSRCAGSAATATSELRDRQPLSSGRVAVPSEWLKSTSTTHETSNTEDAAPCQVTTVCASPIIRAETAERNSNPVVRVRSRKDLKGGLPARGKSPAVTA